MALVSTADVRLTSGVVRGQIESDISVFRGIPFATADRFGAPGPVEPWSGVRPAVAFDEGLTVNVWSPDTDATLPVMVWIYGGGYEIGTSSLPEYDGAVLARTGPVVVVTFNYRIGVEGFGHVDGAPPNRGLLDQVAALAWVRDNITGFGGDPGRVTAFGVSAGGGSIAALLAMPRAAGLFQRAIVQSMPGTFFSPELAADIAASGFAASSPRWGLAGHRSIRFSPVVDGDILPTTPWEAPATGVTLLAGHTRDEQSLFTALTGPVDAPLGLFGPVGAYPDMSPEQLHELIHSDWLFRMPTVTFADAHAAAGGRTYLYELTWAGGPLGACHGLDVPLVFGNLTRGETALLIGDPTPEAIGLSHQMRTAWTAFATHGDPGWPAYHPAGRLTRIFDVPGSVGPYPESVSHRIWRSHRFAPLPLLDE
ncbi:carboxylesterase family protein [Actinoplanes sp. NPDC051851]|uniref:carboxylesterase/lipase family protein n=1 Tax=Actinoplanes sp. NPDC051851 TaxID=3154753 RepID=UPI00344440F1